VSTLHLSQQLIVEVLHPVHDQTSLESASRSAPEGREQRRHRNVELLQRVGHNVFYIGASGGEAHEQARQRPDLHRMIFPARRLQPGIFSFDIQLIVRRFRAGEVKFCFSIERMQSGVVARCVGVPGMRNVFLDFLRIAAVHRMHFVQVAVEDCAARELEVVRLSIAARRQIAIGEIVLEAAAVACPIFVETGNRH
jgi:hypothetical protein